MKKMVPVFLLCALLLPHILFSIFATTPINKNIEVSTGTDHMGNERLIFVKDEGKIIKLELDQYLIGVLLGEVPADFETDALKAQAVAARTYTLRRVIKQNKHADAHICTDPACCQSYVSMDSYLASGRTPDDYQKIARAVQETVGQVLTYNGALIEATYFSCSGGRTEDAVAVWGASIPYLQSVSSPGEEIAKTFEQDFLYERTEFLAKLGLPSSESISLDAISFTYTDGGGVDKMQIGDTSFSGTQVRTLLSLPSTVFTLETEGDTVRITTRGNGHRVGLSQYGAEAMAMDGKDYMQILCHYYPGAKLETFTSDQINAVFDKAWNL